MDLSDRFSATTTAKRVLRLAATGSLATLTGDGAPFVSLVTTATTPAGEPILLLSKLAAHSRNLAQDPRAALLLVAPGGETGDPLAGARLTVSGRAAAEADPALRHRFLAHHREAAGYAGFADFACYRLAVASAHLVAGFGRIVDLDRAELLTDCTGAEDLLAAEESVIDQMNADHADALSLYATRLLKLPPGEWRMTGADPEGIDLRAGAMRGRLTFDAPVRTTAELRRVLAAFARNARL